MMDNVYHHAQKENSNIQIKTAKFAKKIVMIVKVNNNAKKCRGSKVNHNDNCLAVCPKGFY